MEPTMNYKQLEESLSIEDILKILQIKLDINKTKERDAQKICSDLSRLLGSNHIATEEAVKASNLLYRIGLKIENAFNELSKIDYIHHIFESASEEEKRFWVYKTHRNDLLGSDFDSIYSVENPRTEPVLGPLSRIDCEIYIKNKNLNA
jgi:hypothetical protein